MNIDDIIHRLSNHVIGELPTRELIAASEQRVELTPRLLDYLHSIAEQGDDIPAGQRIDLVFFAFYLLAQFREAQALPLLLRIVSASPATVKRLLGFVVSESLGRILASVMVGEDGNVSSIEPLQELIENENIDPQVRYALLTCLNILVFQGVLPRAQLVAYFQQLFAGGLLRQANPVWSGLVLNSIIAGFAELEAPIKETFKDEILDDWFMAEERLDEMLREHSGEFRIPPYYDFSLIDDCVAELKKWASFNNDAARKHQSMSGNAQNIQRVNKPWPERKANSATKKSTKPPRVLGQHMALRSAPPTPPKSEPVVRQSPKVGRNAPCPCGSGRKFKKCCG